jgi:carbamoyl-phosphate synthase large subunit
MDRTKTTVLITGAGGAAVPSLIELLRRKGYRVLAADMNPDAVGFYVADRGFVIPGGLSPDFASVIDNICTKEAVRVIIPLVDEELVNACELEARGYSVILPKVQFISTCLDKYLLMQELQNVGINVPETRLVKDGWNGMDFPIVIKPRTGRGSRGLGIMRTEEKLLSFIKASSYAPEELIVQEFISGKEYTISVVVWRDGEVQAVVPKEIISKQGITKIAVTRKNQQIDTLCRTVQERLNADGPFNVQLKFDPEKNEPMIFEINPRFSTSITLTIAAGVDELNGIIEQALYGKREDNWECWKEGIVMIRQSVDMFMNENEFCVKKRRITKYNQ